MKSISKQNNFRISSKSKSTFLSFVEISKPSGTKLILTICTALPSTNRWVVSTNTSSLKLTLQSLPFSLEAIIRPSTTWEIFTLEVGSPKTFTTWVRPGPSLSQRGQPKSESQECQAFTITEIFSTSLSLKEPLFMETPKYLLTISSNFKHTGWNFWVGFHKWKRRTLRLMEDKIPTLTFFSPTIGPKVILFILRHRIVRQNIRTLQIQTLFGEINQQRRIWLSSFLKINETSKAIVLVQCSYARQVSSHLPSQWKGIHSFSFIGQMSPKTIMHASSEL